MYLKLYIGEACWAFLFGVIIGPRLFLQYCALKTKIIFPGPYGGDIFDPRSWGGGSDKVTNQITLEVTRVVLAISVFAIGVELPKAYMLKHWKSIFFLIVPVMTYVSPSSLSNILR
jgi:NhaP-type Na+/H+ or K+/H+ antiporter